MADNMRIMPDWMYDTAPGLVNQGKQLAQKLMFDPQAVPMYTPDNPQDPKQLKLMMDTSVHRPSTADLALGMTPLATARDAEQLYQNGLPEIPATFGKPMMDAAGSDAGKMALTTAAGLATLMPMMARGGGPKVRVPHQPHVMPNFEAEAPSAFRHQAGGAEPIDDPTLMSRMLREQAGSIGSHRKSDYSAETDRLNRMVAGGYERNYYRGGKSVADGDFYTPDQKAASDFAKRYGEAGDVREYALRKGDTFSGNGLYGNDVLSKIADTLKSDFQVKPKLADEFATMADDFGGKMPGGVVMHIMKNLTGSQDSALSAIGKHFDSADFGQEVVMFNRGKGGVRDANKAAFDPKKKFDPSPFAGVAGAGLLMPQLFDEPQK